MLVAHVLCLGVCIRVAQADARTDAILAFETALAQVGGLL